MCQFLETIQLLDGDFKRLDRHQTRMEQAISELYPGTEAPKLCAVLLQQNFPKIGLFKCRVLYDKEIKHIEFQPYTAPSIRSLKVVYTEMPILQYKSANRSNFEALKSLKNTCDDVLIVKDGLLTDTSYCNIALFDGKVWYTPKKPLILGVNRAQLLNEGTLILRDIQLNELFQYKRIRLFNALNEFGSIEIDISAICH